VFQDDAINQYQRAFQAEWQPVTPTEQVLVQELARHAAALRRAQQAEGALLRESALAAVDLWPIQEGDQDCPEDRLLAASVATEGIDRLTRYRRAHEKAFLATLTKLREAKASRQPLIVSPPDSSDWSPTEADCAAYLLGRLRRKECGCPRCGARPGYWLASRQRWQCARCHFQFGLRAGTVMAGSHLPLSTWFRTIRLVVQNPNVSHAVLRTAIATH
jgi:ribosomal protein S27AE